MDQRLHPAFTEGTHRLVAPEQTLARLEPLLERLGITRVAEITGLDEDLGVPTFTAIRPGGVVLQTGCGKGLTRAAARVSAVMEAAEFHHAEHPAPERLLRGSARELQRRGVDARVPARDRADRAFYHSPDHVIDWVEGEELLSGQERWIPASAAFFVEPTIHRTSTNGLAAGNHLVEATLHGLYEVLERDAISRLVEDGELRIRERCRVVDLETITEDALQRIFGCIRAAHGQLVLMKVPTQIPVHVFWAVLLNHRPHRASTMLNTGAGAHLDPRVAASRAITEAIQSRLTLVQAARDDIIWIPSFGRERATEGPAFRYFAQLDASASWSELEGPTPAVGELRESLAFLLQALGSAGHCEVLRVDLGLPEVGLPVVKVFVPSMHFRRELF